MFYIMVDNEEHSSEPPNNRWFFLRPVISGCWWLGFATPNMVGGGVSLCIHMIYTVIPPVVLPKSPFIPGKPRKKMYKKKTWFPHGDLCILDLQYIIRPYLWPCPFSSYFICTHWDWRIFGMIPNEGIPWSKFINLHWGWFVIGLTWCLPPVIRWFVGPWTSSIYLP